MHRTTCFLVLILACEPRVDAPVQSTPVATPATTHSAAIALSFPDAGAVVDATIAAEDDADGGAGFDQYAWATARGIDTAKEKVAIDGSCRAVTLGDPAREALWCEGGAPIFQTQGGESVFPLVVVDIDRGHLRELLRVPLYAGALDFDSIYVRLAASLASDGRSITVAERPEQTCAMARAAAKKLFPSKQDANGLRDWLTAIDRACAGAVRYVWQNGRFTKVHS